MGTLVGLFESREKAQRAAAGLREAGFASNDISVVMRDRADAAEVAGDAGLGETSAAGAGAVGGGVLGAAAGLAMGLGALTIPGVGPFLAVGPIVSALTGAGIGAVGGGLLGALSDHGVPAEDAPHYQEGVERGGVLVTVKAPDGREAEAHKILEREGLRHLSEHRELWKNSRITATTPGPRPRPTPRHVRAEGRRPDHPEHDHDKERSSDVEQADDRR